MQMPEKFFLCPPESLQYLSAKDKKLARAIALIGPLERAVLPDAFAGLAHAIIGQQISSRAQESIWKKFKQKFPSLSPQEISVSDPDNIRACGLSFRKAGYIAEIARLFATRQLVAEDLAKMRDDVLCKTLTQLNGIGPWTADMLMIFTFKRENILSSGDLGIQRGLRMLYGHREITGEMLSRYHKRYSPFATYASFYLWEIAGGNYPHWHDPAVGEKKKAPGKKKLADK